MSNLQHLMLLFSVTFLVCLFPIIFCNEKVYFWVYNHTKNTFPLLPVSSCLCCLILTPPGWFLHQSRQELWPWFLPLSLGQWPASAALLWELVAAVITSGTQALGLPHRWHGGCRRLKRGKRGSFCAVQRRDVRNAARMRVELDGLPITLLKWTF